MTNRVIATALSTIGMPATISWVVVLSQFTADGPNLHTLWAVPLALVTLPTLPLALKGSLMLIACDEEDFHKRTQHLPHINLPKEYSYIEVGDLDDFLVQPFYYMDEVDGFESLHEARKFLLDKGFEEVVALDLPHALDTYWIKGEEDCFLCKGLCNRDHD